MLHSIAIFVVWRGLSTITIKTCVVKIKLWGNFFLHKSQKIYHHIVYVHILYTLLYLIPFLIKEGKRGQGENPFEAIFFSHFIEQIFA